ncbi:ClpXP protease specificity-enhancing factor [Thiomicrorhabdus sp. zzn3]|uniref:ClpXP protease specificity-enhancing factor n=1 Tax=Thiomicrorhabdus sp. zzn3 TaxID=3039775 RepID=UPI002436C4DF|nr:ClpXP protease specificity-enhancing factor [Thiomicrorhabdus sp. zzn3]MDG6778553.1 ClpXP protease specificity-enhancing factor [Thiomicrorhabdus sp. zzn3]
MISNRPYIIRAMYEWMVDNEWTPHVQVDANYPGIRVPQQFAQDGVIVLNVSPSAVVGLQMHNDWFSFKARFQGIEQEVGFPPEAVLAIFARENGQGMPFPPEPYPDEIEGEHETSRATTLSAVKSAEKASEGDASSSDKTAKATKNGKNGKKPSLSIVK